MANKKSEDSPLDSLMRAVMIAILIIVGIIIIALTVMPFFFLIYGIVCFFLFRGEKDKSIIQRNFWLTVPEQETFINQYNTLHFYENKKDKAWEAVYREGVHINKDGSISQRSHRGQDLRGAINESEGYIKTTTPVLEHMQKIPIKNWKKVRRHFINRRVMPLASCVGFMYYVELIQRNAVTDDFMSYLPKIGYVSLCAWLIGWIVMAIIFGHYFDKPSIVTIHNVRPK